MSTGGTAASLRRTEGSADAWVGRGPGFVLASALASLLALAPPVGAAEASGPEPAARPNVVLILADDLGWRDVSYHGSEIDTPSIDRIAREGVELDRFYAQPSCSPTRAALMTGKSPQRLGIERPISKNQQGGLPVAETTLATHLARQGYQPLMVGKWHLGHSTPDLFPNARGFESFYGFLSGGVGYWDRVHGGGYDWQRNGTTLREEGYVTHLLADEAVRLLAERDRSRPTFLFASFSAPHLPNEAPAGVVERYAHIEDRQRRLHAAMVHELDVAIGRLLAALETEGMLDDPLVLFASDNGGLNSGVYEGTFPGIVLRQLTDWFGRPLFHPGLEFFAANVLDGGSDNRPLSRGKGSVAEGGTRVPAAILWPGHLEAGRHDGFMTVSDVLPTLLEAIGAPDAIPDDLDGRSQWAALRGDPTGSETPDYVVTGLLEGAALYRPPWKLIEGDPPRLYDVYADPLEESDQSADRPELVADLVGALDAWPRAGAAEFSIVDGLLDPDSFGGEEDRATWVDAARERAQP